MHPHLRNALLNARSTHEPRLPPPLYPFILALLPHCLPLLCSPFSLSFAAALALADKTNL